MLASDRLGTELNAAQERVAELVRRCADPDPHFAETLPDAVTELQTLLDELATAHEELRQQQEQMLKISEAAVRNQERYRELFDFAPDGYIVTDGEGLIYEANQPAGALLG